MPRKPGYRKPVKSSWTNQSGAHDPLLDVLMEVLKTDSDVPIEVLPDPEEGYKQILMELVSLFEARSLEGDHYFEIFNDPDFQELLLLTKGIPAYYLDECINFIVEVFELKSRSIDSNSIFNSCYNSCLIKEDNLFGPIGINSRIQQYDIPSQSWGNLSRPFESLPNVKTFVKDGLKTREGIQESVLKPNETLAIRRVLHELMCI